MKKEYINPFDYADKILSAVKGGVLLSTNAGGRQNFMTISWGSLGIEWNKPIFTAFVRESRFTKELLDKTDEFTVCIPFENKTDKNALAVCGSKSGRDIDKTAVCGLTEINGEKNSCNALKELPLTLECRVLYKSEQDFSFLSEEIKNRFYPYADPHTAYIAEIVSAYIIKE